MVAVIAMAVISPLLNTATARVLGLVTAATTPKPNHHLLLPRNTINFSYFSPSSFASFRLDIVRRNPLCPLASRAFSSSSSVAPTSSVAMGDVADSSMDAVQRRLMFEDECILVDENDKVVGHDSKYNCHLMEKIESENLLHRAFSVFLFNSKFELLLQQRSATKVTFPLVWTNTCCSHPLYRESELIEENYLVDYLLFIVRDVNVNPNPDEVAAFKYVNRDQLKELLRKADAGEEGLKLSPWFKLVVDGFLFKWWDHAEKGTLQEVADMKTIHKMT